MVGAAAASRTVVAAAVIRTDAPRAPNAALTRRTVRALTADPFSIARTVPNATPAAVAQSRMLQPSAARMVRRATGVSDGCLGILELPAHTAE